MSDTPGAIGQPDAPRYFQPGSVLVLGGTGFVGRSLGEALVAHAGGGGLRIVVPSRRPQRAQDLRMLPGVELPLADIHDDATLARLVAGRDAVVNLVGILHGNDQAFQRAHVELPRRLVRACRAAGVRRIVHVSALGAAGDAPSRYLRTKAGGEAVLRAPALDITVLRPSVMFGEGDRFLNLFAGLQRVFPLLPLAGAGARFQPVWVENVVQAIVRCLGDRQTIDATYECAGPTVYTLAELVRMAGAWSGHPRPILPLPSAIGRLQALLMEWLPGEPLMSRDNLDSMRIARVASGVLPDLTALGIHPASIDSVMAPLLGRSSGPARLEPLRRHAGRG